MKFDITYRTVSGRVSIETIDAPDRDSVFAILKERGITAIRVSAPTNRRHRGGVKSPLTIALSLLAVLGLGIATFLFLVKRDDPIPPKENLVNRGQIQQQYPSNSSNTVSQARIDMPPQKEVKRHSPFPIHTDEFGVRRYPNGVRVYDDKTPMQKPTTPFGDKPVFANKYLNELASFINLQPGATLFGTRKYDKAYLARLRQGLEEKIELSDDDDEKTRATKLAIIEIQREFKTMSDDEILSIIQDTYSELMRLARYKNDVKAMVKEAVANTDNLTEEDYEDIIKAANQMLAKEGIAPIRNTILVRKNIQMNNLKKGNQ